MSRILPTLFVKTTDFPLVFDFEQTHTITIIGEHGIERFSLDCRKTKTKVNTLANQRA